MKAFKTIAMVAVAGCVFAGAEAAQAGPLDFLNPFTWGNQNAYSTPSFSTGTVCGPTGCYPGTNSTNVQYPSAYSTPSYSAYGTIPTYSTQMNCVNGQCYPTTNNCPGGVCPPTTNTYRMPSTSTTTPVYYAPTTNTYQKPVVQPVSGSYRQPAGNVSSPFYN